MRVSGVLFLWLTTALASIAAPAALTLTAQAETSVLLAQPLALLRATANSSRYRVETTPIVLTFTNTGDTPLKLSTYNPARELLQLDITGPDPSSVVVQPVIMRGVMRAPTAEDYPVLKPGERWTTRITFPGVLGRKSYILQTPGVYRLHCTYACLTSDGKDLYPASAGSWHGVVSSNEVSFTVLPVGDEVNGVQMACSVEPAPKVDPQALTVTTWVRNVSDHPITVPVLNGLVVYGTRGEALSFTGGADESRLPRPDELAIVLPSGGKKGLVLSGCYHALPATTDAPQGTFTVTEPTGPFRTWQVTGPVTNVQGVLDTRAYTPPARLTITAPLWQGKAASPRVPVDWNLSPHRAALLKQELATFVLDLSYTGQQEKPFYGLRVQTTPPTNLALDPFYRTVQISTDEATALIDALAKNGILRDMQRSQDQEITLRAPTGYMLRLTGGPAQAANWHLALGWDDLTLFVRLDTVQTALPAKAKDAMAMLQGRLSGIRTQLESAAALQHRVTLTLADGQTFGQAVAAICQATGNMNVRWQVSEMATTLPVPAGQLHSVPAIEALRLLATSINTHCAVQGSTVHWDIPAPRQ